MSSKHRIGVSLPEEHIPSEDPLENFSVKYHLVYTSIGNSTQTKHQRSGIQFFRNGQPYGLLVMLTGLDQCLTSLGYIFSGMFLWLRFSSIFCGSRPQRHDWYLRVVRLLFNLNSSQRWSMPFSLSWLNHRMEQASRITPCALVVGVCLQGRYPFSLVLIAGIQNCSVSTAKYDWPCRKSVHWYERNWGKWTRWVELSTDPVQKPKWRTFSNPSRWRISQVNLPSRLQEFFVEYICKIMLEERCPAAQAILESCSSSSLNWSKDTCAYDGTKFHWSFEIRRITVVCLLLHLLYSFFLYLGVVLARTSVGRKPYAHEFMFLLVFLVLVFSDTVSIAHHHLSVSSVWFKVFQDSSWLYASVEMDGGACYFGVYWCIFGMKSNRSRLTILLFVP